MPKDWQQKKSATQPSQARQHAVTFTVLLGMVLAIFLGVLAWMWTWHTPRTFFVGIRSSDDNRQFTPHIPFVAGDFTALQDGTYPWGESRSMAWGPAVQPSVWLAELLASPLKLAKPLTGKDYLVVYVRAHGILVGQQPMLLRDDLDLATFDRRVEDHWKRESLAGSDASHSGEALGLPVRELLDQLSEVRAKCKLLVLDTGHIAYDARLAIMENDFFSQVQELVAQLPGDCHLWVLTSSWLGEIPARQPPISGSDVSSESVLPGRSLFGNAFSAAFRQAGAAETGRLTLADLHTRLHDACRNLGQTPRLLQAGMQDDVEMVAAAEDVEIAIVPKAASTSAERAPDQEVVPRSEASRAASSAASEAQAPSTTSSDRTATEPTSGLAETTTTAEDGSVNTAAEPLAAIAAAAPQPLSELDLETASAAELFERAWQLRDRCEQWQDRWTPLDFAPQTWRTLNAYLLDLELRWLAQESSVKLEESSIEPTAGGERSTRLAADLSELRSVIRVLNILDRGERNAVQETAEQTIGARLLRSWQQLSLLPPAQLAAQEGRALVQHARDVGRMVFAAKTFVQWHGNASQLQLLQARSTQGDSLTQTLSRLLRTLSELLPELEQRTLSGSFATRKDNAERDLSWLRRHIVELVVKELSTAQDRQVPLPVRVWKEAELLLATSLPTAPERQLLRDGLGRLTVMGNWREDRPEPAIQNGLEWELARLAQPDLLKFGGAREVYSFYRQLSQRVEKPFLALRLMDSRDEPTAMTATGIAACLPFDVTEQLVLRWMNAGGQPLTPPLRLRFGHPQSLRLAVRSVDNSPLPELLVKVLAPPGLDVELQSKQVAAGSVTAEIPVHVGLQRPVHAVDLGRTWQLIVEVGGGDQPPAQATLALESSEILLSARPDEGFFVLRRATHPATLQLRPVTGYAMPFQLELQDQSTASRKVDVELLALPPAVTAQTPAGILFRKDSDTNVALQRRLDALLENRSHDCRSIARLAEVPLKPQDRTPLVFLLPADGDASPAAAVDASHGLVLVVRHNGVDAPQANFVFPIELCPLQPREYLEPSNGRGIMYEPAARHVTAAFAFRRLPDAVLRTFADLLNQRPIDVEWQTRRALEGRNVPGVSLSPVGQGTRLATLATTTGRAELKLDDVQMTLDEQGRNYAFDVHGYPRAFVLHASNQRAIASGTEVDQYDKLQFVRINSVRREKSDSQVDASDVPEQLFHTWFDRRAGERPYFVPTGQRVPLAVVPPAERLLVEVQVDGKPDLFDRLELFWNDGQPQVRFAPRQSSIAAHLDGQGRLVLDASVADHELAVDTRRFESRGTLRAVLYERPAITADAAASQPVRTDEVQVMVTREPLTPPEILLPPTLPRAESKFTVAIVDRSDQVGLDEEQVHVRIGSEAQLAPPLDLSHADRAVPEDPGRFEIALTAPSKRAENYWVLCWFRDRLGRAGQCSVPLEIRWPDDPATNGSESPAAVSPGTLQVVLLWGSKSMRGAVETTIDGVPQRRESDGNGIVQFNDVPIGTYVLKGSAFGRGRELTGELEVKLAAAGDFFPPQQYTIQLK